MRQDQQIETEGDEEAEIGEFEIAEEDFSGIGEAALEAEAEEPIAVSIKPLPVGVPLVGGGEHIGVSVREGQVAAGAEGIGDILTEGSALEIANDRAAEGLAFAFEFPGGGEDAASGEGSGFLGELEFGDEARLAL